MDTHNYTAYNINSPILDNLIDTQFEYIIDNLPTGLTSTINSINSIQTLTARLSKIKELGGEIKFRRVINKTFRDNLYLIDSNLPVYLGNALLLSYQSVTNDFLTLFSEVCKDKSNIFTTTLLNRFIESLILGFTTTLYWNGKLSKNKDVIIKQDDVTITHLDFVYHRDESLNYLINHLKIANPLQGNYNLNKLTQNDNNEITFTLSLNISLMN